MTLKFKLLLILLSVRSSKSVEPVYTDFQLSGDVKPGAGEQCLTKTWSEFGISRQRPISIQIDAVNPTPKGSLRLE